MPYLASQNPQTLREFTTRFLCAKADKSTMLRPDQSQASQTSEIVAIAHLCKICQQCQFITSNFKQTKTGKSANQVHEQAK